MASLDHGALLKIAAGRGRYRGHTRGHAGLTDDGHGAVNSKLLAETRGADVGHVVADNGLLLQHPGGAARGGRSEEHTSELQSLMRISYAVFCLKKKKSNRRSPKIKTGTS